MKLAEKFLKKNKTEIKEAKVSSSAIKNMESMIEDLLQQGYDDFADEFNESMPEEDVERLADQFRYQFDMMVQAAQKDFAKRMKSLK